MPLFSRCFRPTIIAALALLAGPAMAGFPHAAAPSEAPAPARLAAVRGYRRMLFEPNQGQAGSQVDFLARGLGYSLFLTPRAAVFAFQEWQKTAPSPQTETGAGMPRAATPPGLHTAVLRMNVLGANPQVRPVGAAVSPGRVNYLVGRDPSRWHVNIPLYSGVRYPHVYPGIDLLYHGSRQQLEYDFVVSPHAHAQAIRLKFEGADKIAAASDGGLALRIGNQPLQWHRPVCYQIIQGHRKTITASYALGKGGLVGFRLGAYDPAKTLVIDPVLVYATYLGGTTIDDASAVAVGRDGSAYIAGYTGTSKFPTTLGLYNQQVAGAFVTKLDPTGSQVIYSTYFGDGQSYCNGIVLDADGNAYVSGSTYTHLMPDGTYACDFPTTPGAFQREARTGETAFVGFLAELSPDGTHLRYGTLLGGSKGARCAAIGRDAEGKVYVAGETASPDFPLTPGAFQTQWAADGPAIGLPPTQAFIAKFDLTRAGRDSLVYSTLLGSGGSSHAVAFAVDPSGRAVVALETTSPNFPVTPGALQPVFVGYQNESWIPPVRSSAYLAELDPDGKRLLYASFLGEAARVNLMQVRFDAVGALYVAGNAGPGLPTTPGAYQAATKGRNPFVLKLDPSLSGAASLLYSTYLGGAGDPRDSEIGKSRMGVIAVDAAGDVYVAGETADADYPTTPDAIEARYNPLAVGAGVMFLSILDPAGSRLLWSTFLGEIGMTGASGLAVDPSGSAYLVGGTTSGQFPTTPGAYLPFAPGGITDGFALKISGDTPPGPYIANLRPYPAFSGTEDQILTITGTGFAPGARVSFNGGAPLPADVVSPTRVMVPLPAELAAAPQPVLITIANPSGGWSSAILPVIDPAPRIILMDPAVFTATTNTQGTKIYGSGMFPGTVVSFNGGAPQPISYDMPGASLIVIPSGVVAHPGTVDVAVINPPPYRGTAHAVITVTDHPPVPVLIGLRPDHIRAGGRTFELIVYGHHLDFNAQVTANGQPVVFTGGSGSFDYETLDYIIPATLIAKPGPVSIVMDNSAQGGGPSNVLTMIVDPAP